MIIIALLRFFQTSPPTPPNPADPNLFYSSVIQCSAAIVAIVGGLFTNNVLNLTVRRKALQDQLDELDASRALRSQEREVAVAGIDRLRLDTLFYDNLEEMVELDPFPSTLVEVQQRVDGADVSEKAFEEEWKELCTEIELVEAALDDIGIDGVLEFEDWSRKHVKSLGKYAIAESWRTEWLARRRYRQKQSGDHRPWPPAPCGLGGVRGGRSVKLPPLSGPTGSTGKQRSPAPEEPKRELEFYKDAVAKQDRIIGEIDGERMRLQERLAEVGSPPQHLWVGLVMLVLLAFTGIIVPLLFMPESASDYQKNGWHKTVVIGGFSIGLVLVFGYFAWLIVPARLRRDRS